MKQILAMTATTAILVLPVALNSTVASAWDYCRTDVTGHMKGCSFTNMDQCLALRSGIGGDCYRDPFLPPAPNVAEAYAYQPLLLRSSTVPESRGRVRSQARR